MPGSPVRIGYTSPLVLTEVFARDFYRVMPSNFSLIITTLAILELTSDEVDESLALAKVAARQMARAGADVVVLGGVPINLSAGGPAGVEELIAQMERECGVPILTSVTAQVKALEAVGARQVGIVQPFSDSQVALYDFVEDYGFDATAIKNAGYPATDLGRIPPEVSVGLARELVEENPETDTVYFPCPHWAVIDQVAQIEEDLNVNVVYAGQAIFWNALQQCDVGKPIVGYGKLLADHLVA